MANSTGSGTFSSSIGEAHNYHRWVVSLFRPYIGKSLLEIGMGHGGLFEHLPPLQNYIGLDIDRDLVAAARARRPDLRYVDADLADPHLPTLIEGTNLDTVLCVNVLEHVEDDQRAVVNLLDLLDPGGHLLLFVPAFRALYTDLDRLAGHVRRYTKSQVRALMPPSRCDLVLLEYFNPIGAIGWWANGMITHRSLETRAVRDQVQVFDRYVLPISRFLNGATRGVFGQSVVCVARKR